MGYYERNLEAYGPLAQAHLAMGEPEQAVEAWERQLRLAPCR